MDDRSLGAKGNQAKEDLEKGLESTRKLDRKATKLEPGDSRQSRTLGHYLCTVRRGSSNTPTGRVGQDIQRSGCARVLARRSRSS